MTSAVPTDVDVVVITHRSAARLDACLDAIHPSSAVLVIDNASDDDAPTIARSRGCRVIENQYNIGFARAVDQAMEHTTAPFVVVVNPDAVVAAGAIDRLRDAMRSEDVGVTAATLRYLDGSEQRSDWPFPSAAASWLEALGLHRLHRRSRRHGREPFDVEAIVGACMLVRRAAWIDVGGFDERFWLYGEEIDFCRRLADRDWRRVVVPDAVAVHEGGASGTGSPLAAEHFLHGTDRFVWHHHGRAALVSHRLALLVGSALRLLVLRATARDDERVTVRSRAVRHCIHALRRFPLSVPTRPLEGVDEIVLCSLERWDDTWRRNQLFVGEILDDPSRTTRVLFVEPPLDIVHELRSNRRSSDRLDHLPRPCPGRPGVWVMRPTKVWPRVLGPWADRSMRRQLRAARVDVGMTEPLVWINDSTWAPLVRDGSDPTLYDITDDWLQEAVPARELRRRRRREDLLLERADRVVVCSPALFADRSARRSVALVGNGVDVEHFTAPRPRPPDLPPSPVAVYVGTLHRERLDLDLVEDCARRLPGVSIVLIGPDALGEDERDRLDVHPNVLRLGPRPYADVPAYVQHADVVIVPHVVSPFTESLDPIKAHECRAVGVCTLATPVAGFRDLGDPVVVADRDRFPARLGELLDDPPPMRPDPTVPTWAAQARRFAAELDAARRRERDR